MAGNYPDVPSWRFALDRDGTQWFWMDDSNVVTAMTTGQVAILQDESDSEIDNTGPRVLLIFPELRDVDGYFIEGWRDFAPSGVTVETSVNSTNGVDGTWVTQRVGYFDTNPVNPRYRTSIQSSTFLAIKAVRLSTVGANNFRWRCVHLYGEPSPAQNPNRLILWHPTLDQRVGQAYFDWGNVPRSSSADVTFRVKNNSATLTASAVRVAMDVLTDTTPSVPGQHSISKDGMTFGAQQTLVADLAPGAISPILTLRRVTPTNAVLSVWAHRIFAEAGGWA